MEVDVFLLIVISVFIFMSIVCFLAKDWTKFSVVICGTILFTILLFVNSGDIYNHILEQEITYYNGEKTFVKNKYVYGLETKSITNIFEKLPDGTPKYTYYYLFRYYEIPTNKVFRLEKSGSTTKIKFK